MAKYEYCAVTAPDLFTLAKRLNEYAEEEWRCVGYSPNSIGGGFTAVMEWESNQIEVKKPQQ